MMAVNKACCRSLWLLVAGVLAALCLSGCAGDGAKRKPRTQPLGLEPVQIQLTLGLPTDANGNGYPDTIHAMAYLFPDSQKGHYQPVEDKGSFYFEMRNPSGQVQAQWLFPPEIVEQAQRRTMAGVGYSMYLRLGEGADQMPPTAMDVRVEFRRVAGGSIRNTGRTTVRLGG